MLQDLHAHTYYSDCGRDTPEELLSTILDSGIQVFGFTDHQYGVGCAGAELPNSGYARNLRKYYDHIDLLRQKYADRLVILRGIEVATVSIPRCVLPEDIDLSIFDYCLIEHIDLEDSVTGGDLFGFARRCGCKAGVAHTDLFGFCARKGMEPLAFFTRMAETGCFWEMNMSYDSIHGYREHEYMKTFFASPEQQAIIRQAGVEVSVGFDGHRREDYRPDRLRAANALLDELGIPKPFDRF